MGQMFATIFILGFGKLLNIVDYPSLSMDTVFKVTPTAVMGRAGLLIRTAKIVLTLQSFKVGLVMATTTE